MSNALLAVFNNLMSLFGSSSSFGKHLLTSMKQAKSSLYVTAKAQVQKVIKIRIAHVNAVILHGSAVRLKRQIIAVVMGAIKKTLREMIHRMRMITNN
jgi:hypothetical protein